MGLWKNKKRSHWIIDLADFYFRSKFLKQRMPLFASFKLTYRCNLSCRACPFHQRAKEENSHMTWDMAINVLHELKRKGCRIIVFEGGEPLMWHDGSRSLGDLVSYAKKFFLRVAVTTNGTFPVDVSADVVWISIDGTKQTHDRLRSNSFDRIFANLEKTRHPNILIHFTINRENRLEMEKLLIMLNRIPVVKGMTFQLFYPYGQGEAPLALSFAERKAALETVIELKERGYPVLNSKSRLRAMIENKWKCRDDVLANVDPDGKVTIGCYVKGRGSVHCRDCGFTPVAEASGALALLPGSVLAGWRTYIRG